MQFIELIIRRLKFFPRGTFVFIVCLFSTDPLPASEDQDLYYNMIEANKAQIIVLKESDLISAELAQQLSRALNQVVDETIASGNIPSGYPNYLDLEEQLIEIIGVQASNIHLGRSRNDLGATMNRMLMRDRILLLLESIVKVQVVLQRMAGDHIIPGFTHAVQAQPTTLAHLLLAFDAGISRDSQRLKEIYTRINKSPLGTAAFTTSGFDLDRNRLAELLGFNGLVENSYDAIVVSTVDSKVEFASALSISALGIGRFAQYLLFQYDDPAPGLLLTGPITGRSSIMPQKRNPSAIERLRLTASEVVGKAHTSTLLTHNTPMYEVKEARQDHILRLDQLFISAVQMYEKMIAVLESLTIRKDLLRKKVDADYSTMTELADILYRDVNLPFRTGHEVASELTTYGRAQGKSPSELSRDEIAAVYNNVTGKEFPLTDEQIKNIFDAAEFVNSRKGIGGPQPESVNKMLIQHKQNVTDLRQWIVDEVNRLAKTAQELDLIFKKIAGE